MRYLVPFKEARRRALNNLDSCHTTEASILSISEATYNELRDTRQLVLIPGNSRWCCVHWDGYGLPAWLLTKQARKELGLPTSM